MEPKFSYSAGDAALSDKVTPTQDKDCTHLLYALEENMSTRFSSWVIKGSKISVNKQTFFPPMFIQFESEQLCVMTRIAQNYCHFLHIFPLTCSDYLSKLLTLVWVAMFCRYWLWSCLPDGTLLVLLTIQKEKKKLNSNTFLSRYSTDLVVSRVQELFSSCCKWQVENMSIKYSQPPNFPMSPLLYLRQGSWDGLYQGQWVHAIDCV